MIDLERSRKWSARWIGTDDNHINCFVPVLPAPYFRAEFDFDGSSVPVKAFFCGLGYSVMYINGRRVGDRELSPTFTEYDKRARYVSYDIREYLRPGRNAVGVVLGTGWYDNFTHVHWHYDRATWRDYTKFLLEIRVGEELLLQSDRSWKCTRNGPLTRDGIMAGEIYDARKDLGDWTLPGYDDSAWQSVIVVHGPGGVLTEETFPPVTVVEKLAMTETAVSKIWDAGKIIAGRARIQVKGEAGAKVELTFSDQLNADGTLFMEHNRMYCEDPLFQTDIYILKGDSAGESWAPDFVYHGFRYVGVKITGQAEMVGMTAESMSAASRRIGCFECSDSTLNRLVECTVNSYIANFPGLPTDCPHREKLGWTGDAHCAVEAGMSLFDMADNYVGWLQSVADSQRVNGQIPGIVPCSGWGFNWGNGAFFDYVLPGIALAVYRFTGDVEVLRKFYPNIKKLIGYFESIAEDHILTIGLGDWSHFQVDARCEDALVLTAFYHGHVRDAAMCAKLLGLAEEADFYTRMAADIASAFERNFYRGNGIYGKGEPTAQALPVYFDLCPEERIPQVVAKLDEALSKLNYQAHFGIAGAKCILLVLSQYGYMDSALKVATQPAVPGWAAWIADGATALRESWDSKKSHCHILFGPIVWWMFRHLAGLAPEMSTPGWNHLRIAPVIPENLEWVNASMQTPRGRVAVGWKKTGRGTAVFEIDLPDGVTGNLVLPGKEAIPLTSGHHTVEV